VSTPPKSKPVLEKTIEAAVVKYAKERGFLVHKMQAGRGGTGGWPDRMFIKNGKVFFIEFKRFGGKLSELQKARINDLQRERITVYVVDNIQYGKDVINGEAV